MLVLNLELGTWNLEPGTWNLELGTYQFGLTDEASAGLVLCPLRTEACIPAVLSIRILVQTDVKNVRTMRMPRCDTTCSPHLF
jgi:hypothetical protein